MADQESEAVLDFEPVLIPEDQIIIPLQRVPTPPGLPDYGVPAQLLKKGLVFNIETSGLSPLDSRIIAIGLADPLVPNETPTVIMLDDEQMMIGALLEVLKQGGYNQLIGYGLSFDYRFILIKAMYYGIDCKEFYDCALYDLMQAVAQGKLEYVYFPQKAIGLSELAEYLWAYPKPFTDAEMLKYWQQGLTDKVLEFTSSQITRILALYLVFRKVSENPYESLSSGTEATIFSSTIPLMDGSTSKLTIPEANLPETVRLKCPICLAEADFPAGTKSAVCTICGGTMVPM